MSPTIHNFIQLDLAPLLAATLAAMTCGLLGNFLVLRKLSLMGDAISHSVLPGLVLAFLITATRNPFAMLIGAAAAGIVTVVLVEVVKKLGRVEPGAAMGVIFSVLFALGVLLIEQAARNVDLDADCVLYGQLEALSFAWFPAADWSVLLSWEGLAGENGLPRQVWTLAIMLVVAGAFSAVFFKELRIAAFDPALATTQGFHAGFLYILLMLLVAAATVASFEAVGSILVIAMLICPAASARLLTDRLRSQMWVSLLIAAACGVGGYFAATRLPPLLGHDAVNIAGAVTVVAGLAVGFAALLGPRHGIIARFIAHRALARGVAIDDLLAALYRLHEAGRESAAPRELAPVVHASHLNQAIAAATGRGLIRAEDGRVMLTDHGLMRAADLIRRHRLWETYLVDQAGFAPDHVHDTAERLEHLGVDPEPSDATVDPHGREIPRGGPRGG